jgi:hypothetical protein
MMMSVPDTDRGHRAKQLKGSNCDKPANPFNTKRVKVLKAAQAAQEALDATYWKQEVCIFESARAGSVVALAMQRQSCASSKVSPQCRFHQLAKMKLITLCRSLSILSVW